MAIRVFYFSILLLFSTGVLSFGQGRILSSTLFEEYSSIPISNAFVFIKNSSIGTTTDANGHFELAIDQLENVELVITHLNFETKAIPILPQQQLEEIIYLKPKALDMQEVIVKRKKGNLKKRKAWLQKFELAFFGQKSRRNKLQILNPEVLWFEETDDELKAHAVDYLTILNKPLGYKMRFYLESFSLTQQEDVYLFGKVFFEDILEELSRKKKIKKHRNRTYLNSDRIFFKSLLQKNVDEGKYEFGVTRPIKGTDSLAYQKLTYLDLKITRDRGQFILFLQDYLTIRHKKVIKKPGAAFALAKQIAVSFLKSKIGQIIFDQNGILLNSSDIEVSGYWTAQRMANLLPIEYDYNPSDAPLDISTKVVDSLLSFNYSFPQEKIYLHLNKPYYARLDQIWFKAYLVNANTHTSLTPSKVVYVDLIEPSGEIIETKVLHQDKIMHGDFQLRPKHKAGQYQIRAYTQNMRNLEDSYFFQKPIHVLASTEIVESDSDKSSTELGPFNNKNYIS